ncbi:MAG: LuxR C-terminal-related transcriptional regulator [Betaproteobacteria bacterium]|nr:LuxR C-terminal-related transcriptional regulator [Betaproteobacteria bacterium]
MRQQDVSRTGFLDTNQRDRLFWLIQESHAIQSHWDFLVWMQLGIRELLPHDILIAAWGDFPAGALHFDVSSTMLGVRTGEFAHRPDLVPFAVMVQDQWRRLERKPFSIQYDGASEWDVAPPFDSQQTGRVRSCLVHGIHNRRDGSDCLYIFVDYTHEYDKEARLLCNVVLPHVDVALRRIEGLPYAPHGSAAITEESPPPDTFGISGREQEIMRWVCVGKTNQEIGLILGISPNTVKNHLKRIFAKMNVSNRAQAAAKFKVVTTA